MRLCISCGVVCQLVLALGCLLTAVIDVVQHKSKKCRHATHDDFMIAYPSHDVALFRSYFITSSEQKEVRGVVIWQMVKLAILQLRLPENCRPYHFLGHPLLKRSAIDLFNQKTEEETILPRNRILRHRCWTCAFFQRPWPFTDPRKNYSFPTAGNCCSFVHQFLPPSEGVKQLLYISFHLIFTRINTVRLWALCVSGIVALILDSVGSTHGTSRYCHRWKEGTIFFRYWFFISKNGLPGECKEGWAGTYCEQCAPGEDIVTSQSM